MKKIYFLLTFFLFSSMLFSQPWLENLPQNKSKEELTFFDYKNAFYEYWAPFNVDKGFYIENGEQKRAIGWKQFKRWEYDMEGQINPITGEFPKKTAKQVYDEYLKENPPSDGSRVANWTSVGPSSSTGGYAGVGRINCIAFHPTDNNTYWVGAASGGLWKTTNNGSSWTCLTDNNGVLAVSDIVIPSDYVTSNTIYIATGDKDHWDNYSIGVLKSTNGGTSWNTTGLSYALSQKTRINRLLIDPNNNQAILAATNFGVFKTTNGGTNWNAQLTTVQFIDMEYKPGDFNTLYGSTRNDGKIYVSSNGGGLWTEVLNISSGYRVEMAVPQNQPTRVYAIVVGADGGLNGIYKSINSGLDFTLVFSGTTLNLLGYSSDGSSAGGIGWYDLSLCASPTNANILLVGGVNTWRSSNGGTSWSIVNHWDGDGVQEVHADKHSLKFRSNGDLFECNDGGIYVSTNSGTFWTDKTNGMVISQMYKLGVSNTVSNENITGLQDNGTKLLSGNVWDDVQGGDGMECLIDYTNVNIQYCSTQNGSLYRTTNHWVQSTSITPYGSGYGNWVTPFLIDPVNHNTLYAGYKEVWKTIDNGTSWTKISTLNSSNSLISMAISASNNLFLYVSDYFDIWKTTDGGSTWSNITSNLPGSSFKIANIAVKNDDPNTLWVTFGNYTANNVYQSINGGTAWTSISTGLPQLPVYSVVQDKQTTSNVHLYAGTELGVYFKNGQDNWIPYSTNLPNVKIGELEIYYANNPQESRIRAATYGRGLWESGTFCPPPATAGVITGLTVICQGQTTVNYTVPIIANATSYIWTLPGGASGTSTTNNISVDFNSSAVSGNITVKGNNSCGDGNYSKLAIIVIEMPATPSITANILVLHSDAPAGNQWYNSSGIINGAIYQNYTVTSNDDYYDIVTLNGCSSEASNIITITNVGIELNEINRTLKFYPNPVLDELIIELAGNQETVNFEILNSIGHVVFTGSLIEKVKVQASNLTPGLYLIKLENGKTFEFKKIIKE